MKYENAKDIFPPELLRELQKYAAGRLVYIPNTAARRPWGEATGYRRQLEQRNREIRKRFAAGTAADTLAEEYCLTPETVKNIIYGKKERYTMEYHELFALYSDRAPKSAQTVFEEDSVRDWGEIYYNKEIKVEFPDQTVLLRIAQYAFATVPRLIEMAKIIEAYRSLGLSCMRILPNRYGEIAREMTVDGHPCVVWAEECPPEDQMDAWKTQKRGDDGRLPFHDDLLTVMAKIGSMHIAGNEANFARLFSPQTTCFPAEYEDWIDEYVSLDLKNHILQQFPALAEKYALLEKEVKSIREALRPMWSTLPTSSFYPLEGYRDILVDGQGRLTGLYDFIDGGSDVCINYFLHKLLWMNDPENAEIFDPEIVKQNIAGISRDLSKIAEHYRFSKEEIAAAPLIYKNLLFGVTYYYGDVFKLQDAETVEKLMDQILQRLQRDEIDFAAVLSTGN